jgi:hypothetical protein
VNRRIPATGGHGTPTGATLFRQAHMGRAILDTNVLFSGKPSKHGQVRELVVTWLDAERRGQSPMAQRARPQRQALGAASTVRLEFRLLELLVDLGQYLLCLFLGQA